MTKRKLKHKFVNYININNNFHCDVCDSIERNFVLKNIMRNENNNSKILSCIKKEKFYKKGLSFF